MLNQLCNVCYEAVVDDAVICFSFELEKFVMLVLITASCNSDLLSHKQMVMCPKSVLLSFGVWFD